MESLEYEIEENKNLILKFKNTGLTTLFSPKIIIDANFEIIENIESVSL